MVEHKSSREDSESRAYEGSPVVEAVPGALSADEQQLQAQGHTAELPRQFSTLSILALSFSITNSWIGYSAVFITPLWAGGGPAVIYCLVAAAVACSLITAGLAELSSAFPSAGGQYQLVLVSYLPVLSVFPPKDLSLPGKSPAALHSWSRTGDGQPSSRFSPAG